MEPCPPQPLSRDTHPDVEREWIRLQRMRGPAWRVQRAVDLTTACWQAALDAFRRARPDASADERYEWLLRHRYGDEMAERVLERLTRGR